MECMLGVIHPYNIVNASPSLLFFCLPLLAIARIPRCLVHALISKALWEQEAAANELGCFDLSAKISYNVCTNLFKKKKKNRIEYKQMEKQKNTTWTWPVAPVCLS